MRSLLVRAEGRERPSKLHRVRLSGLCQLISVGASGCDHLQTKLIQHRLRHITFLGASKIAEGLDNGVGIIRRDNREWLGNGRGGGDGIRCHMK